MGTTTGGRELARSLPGHLEGSRERTVGLFLVQVFGHSYGGQHSHAEQQSQRPCGCQEAHYDREQWATMQRRVSALEEASVVVF